MYACDGVRGPKHSQASPPLQHPFGPAHHQLHQLHEQVGLCQAEQGVDHGVVGLLKVVPHRAVVVHRVALLAAELSKAVVGHLDVLVAVNLDHIAALLQHRHKTTRMQCCS